MAGDFSPEFDNYTVYRGVNGSECRTCRAAELVVERQVPFSAERAPMSSTVPDRNVIQLYKRHATRADRYPFQPSLNRIIDQKKFLTGTSFPSGQKWTFCRLVTRKCKRYRQCRQVPDRNQYLLLDDLPRSATIHSRLHWSASRVFHLYTVNLPETPMSQIRQKAKVGDTCAPTKVPDRKNSKPENTQKAAPTHLSSVMCHS